MEPSQNDPLNNTNENNEPGPALANTTRPTIQEHPDTILSNSSSSLSPEASPQPHKQNKTTLLCLIALVIVALAVAAVFAVPYLTGQNSGSEPQTSAAGGAGGKEEPMETEDRETKITDANTLQELDEKIAILLNTTKPDNTISHKYTVVNKDVKLMQDGDLDQTSRIVNIINSLEPRKLTETEIETAIENSNLGGESADYFRTQVAKGYSGEKVREKYQQVFGEVLAVGAKADAMCEGYSYESQNDFYYKEGFGCGGATPVARFYYKYRYGSTSEKAYVYVATATLNIGSNAESVPVYCDVADIDVDNGWEMDEDAEVCATVTSEKAQTFTLDQSNYTDFTRSSEYRFVFNKADDGTYYFEKVEKIYIIQ